MSVTRALSFILLAGFLLSLSAPRAMAQDEAVQQRKKKMRGFGDAVKGIRAAVAKKDYATIAGKAKQIADNLEPDSFAKQWPRDTTG